MRARSLERRGAFTLACMAAAIVIALLMWLVSAFAEPLPLPKRRGQAAHARTAIRHRDRSAFPRRGRRTQSPNRRTAPARRAGRRVAHTVAELEAAAAAISVP
jgi:hypothetical protein